MSRLNRRDLMAGALAGSALGAAPAPTFAAVDGDSPKLHVRAASRVIIDNDFDGDPDGLAAAAHQLCSPAAEVRLLTSNEVVTPFAASLGVTASHGAERARQLLDILALPGPRPPVAAGAATALTSLDRADPSPAARAIVAEAMRDDPRPLFLTCGGPLTNLASALLIEPRIAERMTLVWIGGAPYPHGGDEYNLASDLKAAQVVFNRSRVPVWQFTSRVYRTCLYSVAELEADMAATGRVGAWLWRRFASIPDAIPIGGAWPLGDSPLVLATALDSQSSEFADAPRPLIADDMTYGAQAGAGTIRVYSRLDFRLIVGDFLARLRLHERWAAVV